MARESAGCKDETDEFGEMHVKISRQFILAAGLGLALALPAGAQELARSVLDQYAEDLARSGVAVAPGDVVEGAGSVEWRNVTFTAPEGLAYTLEFIRAEEIGGDRVRLSYPDTISMVIDEKGEQPEMDITLRMGGVDHVVSGPAQARKHDFSADTLAAEVRAADGSVEVKLTAQDIAAETLRTGTEDPHYAGSFKAASARMLQIVREGGGSVTADMTYTNVVAEMDLDAVSEETAAELLDGRRNLHVAYAVGSSEGTVDFDNPDLKGTLVTSSGPGSAAVTLRDGIGKVRSGGQDVRFTFTMKEMPMPPFEASLSRLLMELEAPLKQTEEPVPAVVRLGLEGLEVSDTLWGMLDPAGTLPREAVNLNIDVGLKLKWLVDVMEAERFRGPPVAVSEIEIVDISLSAAGASFKATGAAEVDNSKMPPMPVGEVNLDLKGGIGLIDKLVSIGLVPEQQAQMVKMMSGMFAVPGEDGPDHLVSKIEMKEDGAILANGQRVR